jgi:hypothetical protein
MCLVGEGHRTDARHVQNLRQLLHTWPCLRKNTTNFTGYLICSQQFIATGKMDRTLEPATKNKENTKGSNTIKYKEKVSRLSPGSYFYIRTI